MIACGDAFAIQFGLCPLIPRSFFAGPPGKVFCELSEPESIHDVPKWYKHGCYFFGVVVSLAIIGTTVAVNVFA